MSLGHYEALLLVDLVDDDARNIYGSAGTGVAESVAHPLYGLSFGTHPANF
jgi:hypothetical protein